MSVCPADETLVALAGGRLVNSLLVRGEDDLGPLADLPDGEAIA